jgi:hypothetical protein
MQQIVIGAIMRSAREGYIKAMPPGIGIEVELPTLIHEIVIGPREPEWIVDLVEGMLGRYGISIPTKRSELRFNGRPKGSPK